MRRYMAKHRHSTKRHVALQKDGEALLAGRKEQMSRLHLEDHFGAVNFGRSQYLVSHVSKCTRLTTHEVRINISTFGH
jgi:hypothetical protein